MTDIDLDEVYDLSFLHQFGSHLSRASEVRLSATSALTAGPDANTTRCIGGPVRHVAPSLLHTYDLYRIEHPRLTTDFDARPASGKHHLFTPPASPSSAQVIELHAPDSMSRSTRTFRASVSIPTFGGKFVKWVEAIAKFSRPAGADLASRIIEDEMHEKNDGLIEELSAGEGDGIDRTGSKEIIDEIWNEIGMYARLAIDTSHVSVPRFLGAFVARPSMWKGSAMDLVVLVTEYAGRECEQSELAKYRINIFDAFETLWRRGLVHGDIAKRHIRLLPIEVHDGAPKQELAMARAEGPAAGEQVQVKLIDLGRAGLAGPGEIDAERAQLRWLCEDGALDASNAMNIMAQ